MTQTVTLFDPTAPAREAQPASAASARTLENLVGKVVGFIDNAKPNFGLLADDLGELLMRKYGVARVIKHSKPSASVPVKPEIIESLTSECDVVITGSGD